MRSTVVSLKKENNNIIECDLDYTQDASDAPLSYGSVQMIFGNNDRRDAELATRVAAGLGERFALFGERVAILEAQRREDKALVMGHLDSCSERWAEAKEETRSLRAHVDERFDRVEQTRHAQHRANVTLSVTILITLFAGALTAILEHWMK
mgnify:FL=1